MPLAHDHAIYLVDTAADLETVAARFETAGFLVTDRDDAGRETARTRQRLICFADGSYIEVLALVDPDTRRQHRYAGLLGAGGGWVDYALVTDRLERELDVCQAAGLPVAGPQSHTRTLSDGRPWGVSLFLAGIGAGQPALPLILQDTEGRDLRIPGNRTNHPNGARGILGVTLVVTDLDTAGRALAALFGPGVPQPADSTGDGGRGQRFALASGWVELIVPGDPASLAARRLATWGEGLVSVTLAGPVGAPDRRIQCSGPWSTMRWSG